MHAKEKAPVCGNRYGAKKQNVGKHPVPIITHPKPLHKRTRIKLMWTPINIALLILAAAAIVYLTVRALSVSPLEKTDLMLSLSNSVFRA